MTIDSINQSAASAYIAQQTSTNTSVKTETPQPQNRLIKDIVELTDEAKAILAEVNNAGKFHLIGQLDLSNIPKGNLKIDFGGYSTLDEMIKGQYGFDSREEWNADIDARFEEHKVRSEYGRAAEKFGNANSKESNAIHAKFIAAAGGLLNGTSFEPDDFSKPIRTTDGRIHPQSDEIRSFLKEHKAELDLWHQTVTRKFPSFEQWKANRAA